MSRKTETAFGAVIVAGLVIMVVMTLLVAAALYVWYRIMAPQLGWNVPSYSAVFWSSFFVSVPLAVLGAIARS